MRLAILIVSLVLVVVVTGCGGPSAEEKQREADRKEAIEKKRKQVARDAQDQAAHDKCESNIGPFLDALDELQSRLQVGLTHSEYGTEVGDVRVAYDRVDVEGLDDTTCLMAAASAEEALNAYVTALDKWSACIDALDCKDETIAPGVQSNWSKAGRLERKARNDLEGIAP